MLRNESIEWTHQTATHYSASSRHHPQSLGSLVPLHSENNCCVLAQLVHLGGPLPGGNSWRLGYSPSEITAMVVFPLVDTIASQCSGESQE